VVVILSCHSELIGNIFSNAGIPHVICIKEREKISDVASIIFARNFYKMLFRDNKINVCQAFEHAKNSVRLQAGAKCQRGEDSKFVLKYHHKAKH